MSVGLVKNAKGQVLLDDPKNAPAELLALIRNKCAPEEVICKDPNDKKLIWPELQSTKE